MVGKSSSPTRLVLIGGGISHIYILSNLAKMIKRAPSSLEMTLISPAGKCFNPGLVGAFMEGICSVNDLLFDLAEICKICGANFLMGEVAKIAVKEQLIGLNDGKCMPFDILSVDIHHQLEGEEIEGVKKFATAVNSFENILYLKKYFQERPVECNITMVGSSGRAVELVFALLESARKMKIKARLTMIDAAHSILPGYDIDVKHKVSAELKSRQVELILGRRITLVTGDFLIFDDHTLLKHDYLVWSTEPAAGPLFKHSGFTVDDKGFMVVNHYLRSVDASNVFGLGGSIRGRDGSYFKMRDYGKNETAILLANIKNRINRVPLSRTFNPSRKHLQSLSLGNRDGIINYRRVVFRGKLAWRIHHHLHKSFLKPQPGKYV